MSLVNTKSMLVKVTGLRTSLLNMVIIKPSMDVKNRILRLPIWKEMKVPCMILWFSMRLDMTLYTRRWMNESISIKVLVISHSSMLLRMPELREKSKTSIPAVVVFTEGYLDLIEKDFFDQRCGFEHTQSY